MIVSAIKLLILYTDGSHIVHSVMADDFGEAGQEDHYIHWPNCKIDRILFIVFQEYFNNVDTVQYIR